MMKKLKLFRAENILKIVFAATYIIFCCPVYSKSEKLTFLTQSELVEFTFPAGWYKNTDDHPYDLQVLSRGAKEATGVFEFLASDLAEDFQAKDIFAMQIADIESKRKNFKPFIYKSINIDKEKIITTETYIAEKNSFRHVYIFSLVELKKTGTVLVVLQTSAPSNWSRNKDILLGIVKSVNVARDGEF